MARILSSPAALALAGALGSILRAFVQTLPGSAGVLLLVAGVALYDARLAVVVAAVVLLIVDWRGAQ